MEPGIAPMVERTVPSLLAVPANMFGETPAALSGQVFGMTQSVDAVVEQTDAPSGRPVERLDVRSLGPPKPLTETLETLADLDDAVLVQVNDRAPQHLYPKLSDRGYEYETLERADATVTVIWSP